MNIAVEANSAKKWDHIWDDPDQAKWRGEVLGPVYDRIVQLVPEKSEVVDLGGGVGTLARLINKPRYGCPVGDSTAVVWDHSAAAIAKAPVNSVVVDIVDWARCVNKEIDEKKLFVSTEFFEHVSAETRVELLQAAKMCRGLIVSVPNNRLGPEDEPQHTIKWTCKEFLDELREVFGKDCRVEVMGGFLLGVCGELAKKSFTLSVTMPVRDEEHDIARTLGSFRGVADQMVVGIDYRCKDRTREIAAEYADEVFEIEDPLGPPDELAAKVHFAHCRNRCLERCTSDWIFMSEGHERLFEGQDELLHLDTLPDGAKVCLVKRRGINQQWAFPWLHRKDHQIKYARGTHNVLEFPPGYFVLKLPQISTFHERHKSNAKERAKQRKVQNRVALTDDWLRNGNQNSLLYLGAEWSEHDPEKAIERLKEFLAVNRNNGPQRYHARLQCAKLLARAKRIREARTVLIGAAADDWSRTDHWFFLGDLATLEGNYEEAIQFFLYASTRVDNPPFTVWWIDLTIYGYLTTQRLTECYAMIGELSEALYWARRTRWLIEASDSPDEVRDEAIRNILKIRDAMENKNPKRTFEIGIGGIGDPIQANVDNTTMACLEDSWACEQLGSSCMCQHSGCANQPDYFGDLPQA